METVLGIVAVVLLWAAVVSLFYLFMLLMVWLSRMLPLTGRRKRR